MQCIKIKNQPIITQKKTELFDVFSIMLNEAGSRDNAIDATLVISGVLENLTSDYPELNELSKKWKKIVKARENISGAA